MCPPNEFSCHLGSRNTYSPHPHRKGKQDDLLHELANPDEEDQAKIEAFVKQMVGDEDTECETKGDSDTQKHIKLLLKVNEVLAPKEKFVKQYVLQKLPDIPGSQKESGTAEKPSKLHNFRVAVAAYTFLFEYDFMKLDHYEFVYASVSVLTFSACQISDCCKIWIDLSKPHSKT